jgi:hypothetical protein
VSGWVRVQRQRRQHDGAAAAGPLTLRGRVLTAAGRPPAVARGAVPGHCSQVV